jgi:hypothetical protein
MSFSRDSLAVLLDRIYANYESLYRPLDKTPRHNLLKVFASVDAGIYSSSTLQYRTHMLY